MNNRACRIRVEVSGPRNVEDTEHGGFRGEVRDTVDGRDQLFGQQLNLACATVVFERVHEHVRVFVHEPVVETCAAVRVEPSKVRGLALAQGLQRDGTPSFGGLGHGRERARVGGGVIEVLKDKPQEVGIQLSKRGHGGGRAVPWLTVSSVITKLNFLLEIFTHAHAHAHAHAHTHTHIHTIHIVCAQSSMSIATDVCVCCPSCCCLAAMKALSI